MAGRLEPSPLLLPLLLLSTLQATVWEITQAQCPPGYWRRYSGNCYYPSTYNTSWTAARQVCLSLGADLASVEDAAENSFIVETFMNRGDIWLGLNDILDEGQYTWTDGSASTYRNWRAGEPSGVDTQNCVNIGGGTGEEGAGVWWDSYCTLDYPFMCKMAEY